MPTSCNGMKQLIHHLKIIALKMLLYTSILYMHHIVRAAKCTSIRQMAFNCSQQLLQLERKTSLHYLQLKMLKLYRNYYPTSVCNERVENDFFPILSANDGKSCRRMMFFSSICALCD
ncbi:hypothetical protein Tsp_06059 [Trichinella spiralis]|uniref:hypothetical protein n=1 Tax=Trichinella spiralis TaxID=6334 RepID=UPI0001EFB246|nr:hypothetical protein Tsp_06059 [Trichinella spiralis]